MPNNNINDSKVYHVYPLLCKNRNILREYLESKGVGTLIHYPIPIHLQKAYEDLHYRKGDFPMSEKIADEELSLPLYTGLTEDEIRYIVTVINSYSNRMN